MIRSAVVFLAAAVSLPLAAQTPATPPPANLYAQYLVDTTATRHPELLQLDLHATPPGGAESVIIASKDAARLGHKSDRDDVEVFKTGTPRVEINRSGDQNVETEVQFFDVNRRTLGTVEMTFPYVAGLDEDALIKKAVSIRDELSRRILDGASLFDRPNSTPKCRPTLMRSFWSTTPWRGIPRWRLWPCTPGRRKAVPTIRSLHRISGGSASRRTQAISR
jgi:iron complex outermembrane receptor protein